MLEEMKLYLKVDGNEEDALIEAITLAAKEYIKNAVGVVDKESELYKIVLKLLVSHWFQNREIFVSGRATMANLSFSVESILYQLKYVGGGSE